MGVGGGGVSSVCSCMGAGLVFTCLQRRSEIYYSVMFVLCLSRSDIGVKNFSFRRFQLPFLCFSGLL